MIGEIDNREVVKLCWIKNHQVPEMLALNENVELMPPTKEAKGELV